MQLLIYLLHLISDSYCHTTFCRFLLYHRKDLIGKMSKNSTIFTYVYCAMQIQNTQCSNGNQMEKKHGFKLNYANDAMVSK